MKNFLRRTREDESGNTVVEFAIMVPVFLVFLMMTVEVGLMTIRSTLLERAMDETVRYIRLNTGAAPTHDDLKARICSLNIVPDCADNLKLEMIVRDIRNWEELPTEYTCTDQSEEIEPMGGYSFGMDNELVILRACAKFTPSFPGTSFATSLTLDGAGDARLTSMTAFVQEPR
jgi:Flp pilus assembly pilin Flp